MHSAPSLHAGKGLLELDHFVRSNIVACGAQAVRYDTMLCPQTSSQAPRFQAPRRPPRRAPAGTASGTAAVEAAAQVPPQYIFAVEAAISSGIELEPLLLALGDAYAHLRTLRRPAHSRPRADSKNRPVQGGEPGLVAGPVNAGLLNSSREPSEPSRSSSSAASAAPAAAAQAGPAAGNRAAGADAWEPPKHFRRSTTKYWVHPSQVLRLKLALIKHLPILKYGCNRPRLRFGCGRQLSAAEPPSALALGARDSSTISSVYFDSADFRVYHERLLRTDGSTLVRVRWYGDRSDAPSQQLFLERKRHRDAWTGEWSVKEREPLTQVLASAFDACALCVVTHSDLSERAYLSMSLLFVGCKD